MGCRVRVVELLIIKALFFPSIPKKVENFRICCLVTWGIWRKGGGVAHDSSLWWMENERVIGGSFSSNNIVKHTQELEYAFK